MTQNPWNDFLQIRARTILWLNKDKNKSDVEISEMLSMDEEQVKLIREYVEYHENEI